MRERAKKKRLQLAKLGCSQLASRQLKTMAHTTLLISILAHRHTHEKRGSTTVNAKTISQLGKNLFVQVLHLRQERIKKKILKCGQRATPQLCPCQSIQDTISILAVQLDTPRKEVHQGLTPYVTHLAHISARNKLVSYPLYFWLVAVKKLAWFGTKRRRELLFLFGLPQDDV